HRSVVILAGRRLSSLPAGARLLAARRHDPDSMGGQGGRHRPRRSNRFPSLVRPRLSRLHRFGYRLLPYGGQVGPVVSRPAAPPWLPVSARITSLRYYPMRPIGDIGDGCKALFVRLIQRTLAPEISARHLGAPKFKSLMRLNGDEM